MAFSHEKGALLFMCEGAVIKATTSLNYTVLSISNNILKYEDLSGKEM